VSTVPASSTEDDKNPTPQGWWARLWDRRPWNKRRKATTRTQSAKKKDQESAADKAEEWTNTALDAGDLARLAQRRRASSEAPDTSGPSISGAGSRSSSDWPATNSGGGGGWFSGLFD
jgi:hypothetical protein